MSNDRDYKIVVVITRDGVQSLTVHCNDEDNRKEGYRLCNQLENVLSSVDQIVKEGVCLNA